jgi:hypothetical protein
MDSPSSFFFVFLAVLGASLCFDQGKRKREKALKVEHFLRKLNDTSFPPPSIFPSSSITITTEEQGLSHLTRCISLLPGYL